MVSKHCFGTAASAFEIIKLDIFTVLQRTISALLWLRRVLHVFHWSVGNYLCARSQLQTQSMRLGNWKVPLENRNHDWSKKWLQQNSRYAVRLITKGGFITASRSKELSLQRQLEITFNLSMRQTILRSTIYPVLTQVIFKEISWPEDWSVLLNKWRFVIFLFQILSRLV